MTNAEKALQLHKEWNGKFETTPKMSITTREDLALAYTPGVAACAPIFPRPRTALPSDTTAIVLDFIVYV